MHDINVVHNVQFNQKSFIRQNYQQIVDMMLVLCKLLFLTVVEVNSSLTGASIIMLAVFISLGSPCIKISPWI